MKRTIPVLSVMALAGLLAAAAPAHAQSANPWSVSFDLGAQIPVSGDAHGGGSGTVLTLPTSVNAKTYNDVYGSTFYWAAGLGYRMTSMGELRVEGNYTSKASTNLQVGTVAGLPLFAKFGDYKAWGLDVGYRQYLGDGSVKPFVGGSVGFAHVDAISATLTVPAAGVTLTNVGFYGTSTVPTFSVGAGAQVHLTDNVALQGGAAFRWQNNLDQVEGLSGSGLQTINDVSRRWSLPVTAGLTVGF